MMRELIDRKYEIIEELGRSNFTIMYRAKDTSLRRDVIIKLPNPMLLERKDDDPALVSHFEREARTIASLQHSNIIDIHEYGEYEGEPFIVMPFLSGISLDKLIKQQGALELAQVLRVTEQIGAALDYMHRQGVIHRNVKPAHILFDKDNQAILTGFGIVKTVDEKSTITQGGILGTPYYMPPEQWEGQEVDARSDLYALGVVVYQMLTGGLPFEGNTTSVMQGHLKEMPPSLQLMNTSLPRSVETVLLKALDKDPEKRYQTASQLVTHLKAALADTMKVSVVDKKPSYQFAFVWIVAAALVLLAICGCGGVIFAGMNGSGPAVALFATETPTVTNTPTLIPIATPTSTNTVTSTPTPTKTPTLTLSPIGALVPTNTPAPIPSDTSTPVPPTAIPTSVAIQPTPIPSPPANYQLAYTKFDGTFHNIYIADINGQNEQFIIARAASPSFSPDNKRLYFFGEQGVNRQLDRQDPNPATAELLCDFPTISGGIVAIDLMSPLSDICEVQGGLWDCERRGPGDDVCTANNISVYQNLDWKEGSARLVTISPVNPLVTYDAIPSGDVYRVYFRNAIDFGGPANTEIEGEHPSWSPNGQRLAYRSGRENKFGIWVSNRDDSEYDWVVWNSPSHPGLSPSFPTWSPDNQTIAYSGLGNQGGQDIYIRKWDKSNDEQNLTNASSNDTLPVYTPDGKQIIFRSDRGGSWGIWKMNSDGTNPVQIIANAPVGPDWAFSKMDVKSASPPSDTSTAALPTTIPSPTIPSSPTAILPVTASSGELVADSNRDFRSDPLAEGEWRYVWAEAYNTGWWLPTVDGPDGCYTTDHPDFDFAICQNTIRNNSRAEIAVQWKPLVDGDWLLEWDGGFRFFHRGDLRRSEGPGPTLPNSVTLTELIRDWDDFFWAAPPSAEFPYHIRIYYLGIQE